MTMLTPDFAQNSISEENHSNLVPDAITGYFCACIDFIYLIPRRRFFSILSAGVSVIASATISPPNHLLTNFTCTVNTFPTLPLPPGRRLLSRRPLSQTETVPGFLFFPGS